MPQQTNQQTKRISEYTAWLGAMGYVFRLNEVTGQVEVNGVPLTDDRFAKIQYQLIEKGATNERFARVAVSAAAYDNRYNPIKDYLLHLPYDGGDYYSHVVSCFDNPDGLLPVYLRKWMLGAISKTLAGTQNRMLILDGPQGVGKSKFVSWLCSGIPEYFSEGSLEVDTKDAQIRLTQKWIWEVGELGNTLRKADREALKNLITMQNITFRRPYGRYDETKPVLANLIGTINNEGGFLDDPTGSRRFAITHIRRIDWQAYTQIDVNKLWGEIYASYLIGEETDLTPDQREEAEANNKNYEVEDPIDLVIRDQFRVRPGDNTLWTSTARIMYVIQDKIRGGMSPKAFQMSLAAACKKLGLERGQQNNQRGYYGIEEKVP